jgi:glycosyltransferase involved in cell wall biosynthesis
VTDWLLVSASPEEAAALEQAGPRRDFVALAARLGASVLYGGTGARGGWRGRLLGPHLRQAWHAASRIQSGDRVFADGEHVGIPLLLALGLRLRRPSVVMIGHMPGRWWKRALLAVASRLGVPGTLLVHSRRQLDLVRPWLGPAWRMRFVHYQVDTDFWVDAEPRNGPPLILAVGSEQRDYDTLIEAARGLPAEVLVAAGSHWAREAVAAGDALPPNVRIITETLSFRDLLERYRQALIVVVPLKDAANQAGVTTLLEAMSVGRPVVVTASTGQAEVITGPLVTADGSAPDPAPTADRGPRAGAGRSNEWSGLYVPLHDPAALRRALELLLGDGALRARLAEAARDSVERHFTFEAYIDALEQSVATSGRPDVAGLDPAL